MKVEVHVSVAYGLYSERESIPKWMTFISSVKMVMISSCRYDGSIGSACQAMAAVDQFALQFGQKIIFLQEPYIFLHV
ncbi:hypothetical protein ARALYDRAFT_920109 [Arabidopsis lyrata subsp. lyrata]|uniref:Uncharacterized protein n=1 Tax=Arabidopsis lyrata subsp. lyrata TaxID=81972 RepID=D7MN01_ARALL|nr:hypothetical protein ARALYDRAFT_920109 [Arabidopsis lyrata subsp. lyrata]